MISDKEFLEIIEGLHRKTAKENLNWQVRPNAGYDLLKGREPYDIFWVQLPQSTIEIQYASPRGEPDFINLTIARGLGLEILATRKVYEGDLGWEPLSDLFALVKRRHLGWDDVFKNVRDFLGQPTGAK